MDNRFLSPSRLLSLILLSSVALSSAACDRPTPDNQGGGGADAAGGGGASNTTTNDTTSDTGSTTDTDTTAQGGGGAGGGAGGQDPGINAAVCEKVCLLGTCDGNVCNTPETLYVLGYEAKGIGGAGTAGINVNRYGASAYMVEVLGTNGVCHVLKYTSVVGPMPQAFDAGDLSLEGPTCGTVALEPEPGSDSILVSLPSGGLFAEGDTLTANATGGADYATFSISNPAPAPLTLEVPAVVGGQPLSISWSPAPPPDQIQIIGSSNALMICKPQLPGSLVIPGNLTALLGGAMGSVSINGFRYMIATQEVGGNGANVAFMLQSLDAQVVDFMP